MALRSLQLSAAGQVSFCTAAAGVTMQAVGKEVVTSDVQTLKYLVSYPVA